MRYTSKILYIRQGPYTLAVKCRCIDYCFYLLTGCDLLAGCDCCCSVFELKLCLLLAMLVTAQSAVRFWNLPTADGYCLNYVPF